MGYVVHFLNRVCQYLHVVPPFEMRFGGSKSYVLDHDGQEYQLVAEGGNVNKSFFRQDAIPHRILLAP